MLCTVADGIIGAVEEKIYLGKIIFSDSLLGVIHVFVRFDWLKPFCKDLLLSENNYMYSI
jgi:hypothetical protein